MNTRLKVSETMDADPLVGPGATHVVAAARAMRDRGTGVLLVYHDQRLEGILTERDVLHKVVAEGRDPGQTLVRDVMTPDPVTIAPDEDIFTALRLMRQRHIRRLPVVSDGRLLGVITERHISEVAPELMQIADDWNTINGKEEPTNGYRPILEEATAGACEMCGNMDVDLHPADGTLLCEECLETVEEPTTGAIAP